MKIFLFGFAVLLSLGLNAEQTNEIQLFIKNNDGQEGLEICKNELYPVLNTNATSVLNQQNEERLDKLTLPVVSVSENVQYSKNDNDLIDPSMVEFFEKSKRKSQESELAKDNSNSSGRSKSSSAKVPLQKGMDRVDHWITSAEFLYWTAFQDMSQYVLIDATIPISEQSKYLDGIGKYVSASFDWDPGVRLSAGYLFDENVMDSWNLSLNYTYFRTTGSDTLRKPDNLEEFIFATYPDVTVNGLDAAASNISLLYNLGEVWLQRSFKPTQRITFDFGTALAGAWINENWTVNYRATQTTVFKNKWSYHSGGLTTKVKSRWHLGCDIEIFNEFQGGMFLGSYTNKNKTSFLPPISSFVSEELLNPVGNTTSHLYPVIPMLRAALGLQWRYVFNWGIFRLAADVEAASWFNLQVVYFNTQYSTPVDDDKRSSRASGDVTLYGVSFKAGFDF